MHSRLFLGVVLPSSLTTSLLGACAAIRAADSAWRDAKWVPESNLHITLAFLGNVDDADVPALCEALAVVAGAHVRFDLFLDAVRAEPSERRCRMLWAALRDPAGAGKALSGHLARAARPDVDPRDVRVFRAHATLCRARRPHAISSAALDEASAALMDGPSSMSVPSFTLFESRLTPRGAVYIERDSWCLRQD